MLLCRCPETELQGRLPQGVSRLSDQRTTGCKPVLVMLVMRTALLPAATDVLRDVLDADECRAVQLAGHVLLHFWVAASAAGRRAMMHPCHMLGLYAISLSSLASAEASVTLSFKDKECHGLACCHVCHQPGTTQVAMHICYGMP